MIHIHMYMQVLDWYINCQPLWGRAFWLTLWKPISVSRWQVWVWLRNCPHTWVRLCYAPLLPTLPTLLAQRSQVGHVARFPRSWLPANSAICPSAANLHPPLSPHLQRSRRKMSKAKKYHFWDKYSRLAAFFALLCLIELSLLRWVSQASLVPNLCRPLSGEVVLRCAGKPAMRFLD